MRSNFYNRNNCLLFFIRLTPRWINKISMSTSGDKSLVFLQEKTPGRLSTAVHYRFFLVSRVCVWSCFLRGATTASTFWRNAADRCTALWVTLTSPTQTFPPEKFWDSLSCASDGNLILHLSPAAWALYILTTCVPNPFLPPRRQTQLTANSLYGRGLKVAAMPTVTTEGREKERKKRWLGGG